MPYKDKEKKRKCDREYYRKNKEEISQKAKEYREKPEVKTKQKKYQKGYQKGYHQKNKDRINAKQREYRNNPENKTRAKEYTKNYRKNHKRKIYLKEYRQKHEVMAKEYYQKNKDILRTKKKEYHSRLEIKKRVKKYYQKNKDRINARVGKYRTQRKQSDLNFYLVCKLRNALSRVFTRYLKIGKIRTSKQYGINYKAIIEHLKPFPKDIENYHVDHIIPLSLFDFNNPEHIKKAFAPENHQWLTAQQNLEKGTRLVAPCAFE